MTYKMVIFDWDGTLLDSTGAIAKSIRRACLDSGLPDPGEEVASYVIGLGLSQALARAAPQASQSQINLMIDSYRKHYLSKDHDLELFSGVLPLITTLNAMGTICTVATGKSRQGLNRAMSNSGTTPYFKGSRCADECRSKPDPQMILELMDEFNVDPVHVVMIGDTTHDLYMAQSAGVHALSVQSGAHPLKLLNQVPHLKTFLSINELAPWLIQTIADNHSHV